MADGVLGGDMYYPALGTTRHKQSDQATYNKRKGD